MKGIKIGYDGKRAVCNMTGLGNYSRLVVGTMAGMYPDNDYMLFAPRLRENPRLEPLLMRENVSVVTPSGAFGRRCPSLWRSVTMGADVAERGVDLFHGLSNEIPLGPMSCATVVTIHDLIWRKVPGDYKPVDRMLYEFKYRRSAVRATRIIAISERTKADIVECWHIDPSKIDVVYQGCDPIFGQTVTLEQRQKVRQAYGLPDRYIVSVGTIQSRKNQLLAVKALERLPEDIALVLVGGGEKGYLAELESEVSRRGLEERVIRLEGIPFDNLPAIYSAALFSSYTSRYEGFGIPVIESLSVGTPVIACTGSCLEEAGGDGAVYVDPDDVEGYVKAALDLIQKPYFSSRLSDCGRRYVKRFNPQTFATAIMKTYNKAILDFNLRDLK